MTNEEKFKEVFGFGCEGRKTRLQFGPCLYCDIYCDLQTDKTCSWWDREYQGKIEAEWIPVDRRLPEENGNYLVVTDSGERGVHEAVFYRYQGLPQWRDPVEEYADYMVSHWRPMPKLPGEVWNEERIHS